MKITKAKTETYILSEIDRLDPVTVYLTNYAPGQGKMAIECYGSSWAAYWGGMGGLTIKDFILGCDNDYILGKLLKETRQTDFDEINEIAHKRGFSLCVTSDVEVVMQSKDMTECFGADWHLDLPRCNTNEYEYVGRILNAVKGAFNYKE